MKAEENTGTARMKTGMLIRKPAAEVFEAFVDPEITTQFWFSKSSGQLVEGERVIWEWEAFGISSPVDVRVVKPDDHIIIEWPDDAGGASTVEWRFSTHDDATFVEIIQAGFPGSDRDLVKEVADSTEGFTLVLAGLKALLEHGIQLNLVTDRYPPGIG